MGRGPAREKGVEGSGSGRWGGYLSNGPRSLGVHGGVGTTGIGVKARERETIPAPIAHTALRQLGRVDGDAFAGGKGWHVEGRVQGFDWNALGRECLRYVASFAA